MPEPTLDAPAARRLFLSRHALLDPPSGPATGEALAALIRRLGFVQVDSINTVERAHHMILWARRPAYRPAALATLMERDRQLFEHWTHDAAVIPVEFLPYWQMRFRRDALRLRARFRNWHSGAFESQLDRVLDRIATHGPVRSGDLAPEEKRPAGGWWDWHPSKTALEYLWRAGRLAVTRREGFAKVYDLAERVYPAVADLSDAQTVDWACRAALDRLGFATTGQIAAFWAKVTPAEAAEWAKSALARGEVRPVMVTGADGQARRHLVAEGTDLTTADLPEAPSRMRILSPFDPALRDRDRAERLFGFRYRIEVFVPEAQRRFGYYVFPVMERDRLVGRIDARARRAEGVLQVAAFWPEGGLRWTATRQTALMAELDRLARFAGCDRVTLAEGWLRDPVTGP